MRNRMVIIGGGGHAKVVINAAKLAGEYDICGIVDPKLSEGASILGIDVIGDDDKLTQLFDSGITHAFIGIGSMGNCGLRKNIYDRLKKMGFHLPVIRHPQAIVAEDAEIGEGTFVAAGAIVNPGTKIGKNVIINTSSSIDHDCTIGNFVHIAPGVTLSGGVRVGDEAHIGTGANIVQNLRIGRRCFVKAGSTAVKDVDDAE